MHIGDLKHHDLQVFFIASKYLSGGRRSPAVACWASDHWVASSNLLGGGGGGQVSLLISPHYPRRLLGQV